MKAFNTILVLLFALSFSALAQSLTLFDIDTTNFPTMRAKFYAFDKNGNQITNFNPLDFEVKENGEQRNVTFVSCPASKPPLPISSVLVMDASGSMKGNNLDLAKQAANAWIERMQLGISECAITAFNEKNYLIQDFTTDKNKLISGISSLFAQGGTDYDAALYEPIAGGLLITKNAKHKRVIVFLSDGMPNNEPQTNQIISEANQQYVSIYCITLNMLCPQSLKEIADKTNGMWFESIMTVEKAVQIYQQILHIAQGLDACSIEWQSENACLLSKISTNILLKPHQISSNIVYNLPGNAITNLYFEPECIKFFRAINDTCAKITVTANNSNFSITNIKVTNPAFRIEPVSFNLQKGESKELTICYTPTDSGYTFCKFELENDLCPAYFYASGGFPGIKSNIQTLKLIKPNGNEEFVVGADTTITWEGVLPDEKVKIEYSTNNGIDWITIIDSIPGFNYNWKVPKTPSNQCLARVTALKPIEERLIEMVLIPKGSFMMGNTGSFSGYNEEKPVHKVTIRGDFLMSKYEITQKQYTALSDTNPSIHKGDNLPVDFVYWSGAIEFCNKLSDLEGYFRCYSKVGNKVICDWAANGYRLPTEAEWEYACKAGTETDFYSGPLTHNEYLIIDSNLNKIGWYGCNSGGKSNEVGLKQPNAFGLYDMSGNVREWCWDFQDNSYYTVQELTDPKGPDDGIYHIIRGGCWASKAEECRSSYRKYALNFFGFRVVRVP